MIATHWNRLMGAPASTGTDFGFCQCNPVYFWN